MRTCPVCGVTYPNQQAICAKDGSILVEARRFPRWAWEPSVVVLELAIIVAGLAFGLPTSMIAKRADELYKTHHNYFRTCLRSPEQ
jgi:predicted nucleic acid-binding Zn ribbon protein